MNDLLRTFAGIALAGWLIATSLLGFYWGAEARGRLDHLPPAQYVIHAEDDPLPCKVRRGGIENVHGVLVAWCER